MEILKNQPAFQQSSAANSSVVDIREIARQSDGVNQRHSRSPDDNKRARNENAHYALAHREAGDNDTAAGKVGEEEQQPGMQNEAALPLMGLPQNEQTNDRPLRLDFAKRLTQGDSTTASAYGSELDTEHGSFSARSNAPSHNGIKAGMALHAPATPASLHDAQATQSVHKGQADGIDDLASGQKSQGELPLAGAALSLKGSGDAAQLPGKVSEPMANFPQYAAPGQAQQMENALTHRGGTLTYRFANGPTANAAIVDNSVQISLQGATVLRPSNALTHANLLAHQSEGKAYQLMPVSEERQQQQRQQRQDQAEGEDQ